MPQNFSRLSRIALSKCQNGCCRYNVGTPIRRFCRYECRGACRGTSGSDNVSTRDERSHQIGKHRRCILRGMRSATTFGEARLQQFHWR